MNSYTIVSPETAGSCFGQTYTEATQLFCEAAGKLGLEIASYSHPLKGPDGGPLATRVLRLGPPDASRLFLYVSGTHGLEGTTGSGCQVAWLRSEAPRTLPEDVAVLLVHMINPWGSAWRRRQTEDNVDLNRNFQDFEQPLPENPLYGRLHPAFACRNPSAWVEADQMIADFRKAEGDGAYGAAVFGGQYTHPDGVGFGGRALTWSNKTLSRILDEHAGPVRQTAMVDIHTGLGPYGYGTPMATDASGSLELMMLEAMYGPSVVPINEEGRNPYKIMGDIYSGVRRLLPGAVAALGIEFGTAETEKLYRLQIEDCRRTDPNDPRSYDEATRGALKAFFCPATPDWLQALVMRSLQMADQAIGYLGSSRSSSGAGSAVPLLPQAGMSRPPARSLPVAYPPASKLLLPGRRAHAEHVDRASGHVLELMRRVRRDVDRRGHLHRLSLPTEVNCSSPSSSENISSKSWRCGGGPLPSGTSMSIKQ